MGHRTPLYDHHADNEATFTDFAGWEMPVEFSSIREEHTAVRNAVGVFDVSHMGQIDVTGPDARQLTDLLTTGDVSSLDIGESQYTTVPRTDGTMIDDAILYRLEQTRYLLVPNAGMDAILADRWKRHRDEKSLDVEISNQTTEWGMVAIQGPDAPETMPTDVGDLPRTAIASRTIAGVECLCANTGYTGETGFEVIIPWDETARVFEAIDATPCGLGARDTLRLEMGYILAGNEFDDEDNRRTPYEAGLDFVVELDTDPECVAADELRAARSDESLDHLVGFRLDDRGIPRHGYTITDGEGTEIGIVTSGTMSPTLGEAIGLGYVEPTFAQPGSSIGIDIRGSEKRASIVTPPFIGEG